MAKTYRLTDADSDLSLGGAFTDELVGAANGSNAVTAANAGGVASGFYAAEADDPSTSGTSTGSFTAVLNVSTAAGSTQARCYLRRVNSSGAQQAEVVSPTGYVSTATTGDKTWSWTNPALGTWAAGDRVVLRVEVQNNNAHGGAAGPTFSHTATNTRLDTPFTAPTHSGAVVFPVTLGVTTDASASSPTETAVARISLEAGDAPTVDTGHVIKIRARVQSGTGTIRAALYEGASNRSGDLESSALSTSLATYDLAIPEASAANISDYSDLELRLWGYDAASGTPTFEVAEAWLEIPQGVPTSFGAVVSPFTFGETVSARIDAKSAVVYPTSVSISTAATKTTFAVVSQSYSLDRIAQATTTKLGAATLPISVGRTTTATRETFGQVALSEALGRVVSATRETFSSTTQAYALDSSTSATRETFSALDSPYVLSVLVDGTASSGATDWFGAVSLTETLGVATIGRIDARGAVAQAISWDSSVNATRTTSSSSSLATTWDVTSVAWIDARGAVVFPVVLSTTTEGQIAGQVFGAVSLPLTVGASSIATRDTFAVASLSETLAIGSSATRETFAVSALPISVGVSSQGRVVVFGASSLPATLDLSTVGVRETLGAVSSPLVLSSDVSALLEAFGSSSLPLALGVETDSEVELFGAVVLPLVFGSEVVVVIGVPAAPPRTSRTGVSGGGGQESGATGTRGITSASTGGSGRTE